MDGLSGMLKKLPEPIEERKPDVGPALAIGESRC
jgi:hypothetical protein